MPRRKGTPPVRLPRRYKRNGKEYGPFYARVGTKDVNLRTQNADVALKRSKEARAGKTLFEKDDSGGMAAAKAIVQAVTGTGGDTPPVVEPPPPAAPSLPPPAPLPPAALPSAHTTAAALPPAPEPERPRESVHPDGYIPPPAGWADAVGAAAAAGDAGGASEGGSSDGAIPSELLEQIIGQAAEVATELQIMAQAWLIKRRAKIKAAPVPPEAKGRALGVKLWTGCFRTMLPSELPIPDWLAAPLLIAATTLPVQLGEGSEPIKADGPLEGSDVAPAQGAAA